jgi:hypothetical protein
MAEKKACLFLMNFFFNKAFYSLSESEMHMDHDHSSAVD